MLGSELVQQCKPDTVRLWAQETKGRNRDPWKFNNNIFFKKQGTLDKILDSRLAVLKAFVLSNWKTKLGQKQQFHWCDPIQGCPTAFFEMLGWHFWKALYCQTARLNWSRNSSFSAKHTWSLSWLTSPPFFPSPRTSAVLRSEHEN